MVQRGTALRRTTLALPQSGNRHHMRSADSSPRPPTRPPAAHRHPLFSDPRRSGQHAPDRGLPTDDEDVVALRRRRFDEHGANPFVALPTQNADSARHRVRRRCGRGEARPSSGRAAPRRMIAASPVPRRLDHVQRLDRVLIGRQVSARRSGEAPWQDNVEAVLDLNPPEDPPSAAAHARKREPKGCETVARTA